MQKLHELVRYTAFQSARNWRLTHITQRMRNHRANPHRGTANLLLAEVEDLLFEINGGVRHDNPWDHRNTNHADSKATRHHTRRA